QRPRPAVPAPANGSRGGARSATRVGGPTRSIPPPSRSGRQRVHHVEKLEAVKSGVCRPYFPYAMLHHHRHDVQVVDIVPMDRGKSPGKIPHHIAMTFSLAQHMEEGRV